MILPYLDIPFQHASPQVLKSMRRPANQEKTADRIRRFYKKHYDPTHLVVACAGNVDHHKVVRQVRAAFEKAGALTDPSAEPIAPRGGRPWRVCLGRLCRRKDEARRKARVVTRRWLRLWERRGDELVYSVQAPDGYRVEVTNASGRELTAAPAAN